MGKVKFEKPSFLGGSCKSERMLMWRGKDFFLQSKEEERPGHLWKQSKERGSLPVIPWLTPRLSLLAGELVSLCGAGMFAA